MQSVYFWFKISRLSQISIFHVLNFWNSNSFNPNYVQYETNNSAITWNCRNASYLCPYFSQMLPNLETFLPFLRKKIHLSMNNTGLSIIDGHKQQKKQYLCIFLCLNPINLTLILFFLSTNRNWRWFYWLWQNKARKTEEWHEDFFCIIEGIYYITIA